MAEKHKLINTTEFSKTLAGLSMTTDHTKIDAMFFIFLEHDSVQ
jgi:hypothetical protein